MDAHTVLTECPLFAGLKPESIARLAEDARPVSLAGGERLFAAGEPSTMLYIVATGRLRAVFPGGRIAGDIARLEPLGEIGLLTGDVRGASVHALRPSLLYAFSRQAFSAFALAEPAALMAITRVILNRMREPDREIKLRAARKTRTLTVLAAGASVSGSAFAAQLERALGGNTLLAGAAMAAAEFDNDITAAWRDGRLRDWMRQLEFNHKQVVYDAAGPDAWREATLRHADRVIAVADVAERPPGDTLARRLAELAPHAPVDLVLLRREGVDAASARDWKQFLGARSHYFVRPGNPSDIASLARQLTGHGIGLVLGGGGARGFAHVGLLKAMRELDIPVDVCGGASMGAFVAALHASGRDIDGIASELREAFVRRSLLNDYTLPRISLIAGKKFHRHLQGVFGSLRVEHMATPFYCVSTNLTHGRSEVHDEGLVADWLAASMCIPGLAPPIAWKGSLLCDGAVVNSLPTDVMQDLGRGLIVACDVSTEGAISASHAQGDAPDFEAVHNPPSGEHRVNLMDVLFRTTSLTSESGSRLRAERADLYLRMPVGDVKTFDWPAIDALIEKGYRHAMENLPALLAKSISG